MIRVYNSYSYPLNRTLTYIGEYNRVGYYSTVDVSRAKHHEFIAIFGNARYLFRYEKPGNIELILVEWVVLPC